MTRPVGPRLRWDGSDQARSFREWVLDVVDEMRTEEQREAWAPLTLPERARFWSWETFYAVRDGVPWAGHWQDLALAAVAVALFVLFGIAAAWPDRTPGR